MTDEQVEQEVVCLDEKQFSLGNHATADVQCALPEQHWIDGVIDVGVTYPKHQYTEFKDDGSTVTYRWPVEVKE